MRQSVLTYSGSQLEKAVKDLLASLDKPYANNSPLEQYLGELLPQLKHTSPVVLNGNPIGGKLAFQQHWVKFPLTQHLANSVDYHTIVGTGTVIVNVSGKVRFDESGKTRLGETADVPIHGLPPTLSQGRPSWGSWYAFNANLILDETVFQSVNAELVNSFNWRIVYKPEDAAVTI